MKLLEKKITVNGLEWFYRETKTKVEKRLPIVFLHGLPSQSFSWCEVMTKLEAANFYCVAPDWIGSGFSSFPSTREFDYTAEALQTALKDFLNAIEIERCHLVVQGYLGHIGILFAQNYPELCDRLVILNSPVLPGSKVPFKMKQWTIPFVGDMLTQDPLLVDRTLEGGSGFVISDGNLDVYRKPFLTTSAAGRALMAVTKKLDLKTVLPELSEKLKARTEPTLFLWGMEDAWLDNDGLKNWVKSETSHKWVSLDEAKHYPQEHFAEAIAPELSKFLAG
ncbi:alpha/beta hydrolase fold protein [[Leptolyngbya] sp. PCC 7376]|uniref:alpha/beta fold hydrolase n=1 Tax=[Leptolyngbya] sp. PCC 7376 TaxID=111781 RepID=UPI00029F085B|nr:alpha/beta fold hydrolase [[Leptolyngbya] sp. PCC 7376]AFY38970.1 alpha/beta hydrolase fold protein [[Leptolyngbya] sp. PCC 7376]